MNKITREHYPVSKLPEELKKEFEGLQTVKIVGDPKDQGKTTAERITFRDYEHQYEEMMSHIKPMTLKELLADREAHPEKYRGNVTPEEAVARVREIRDEWDSDR
ncbi:hypothetical protein [Rhizobium sp. LjRoot254]|uniref:hypothetical protein n=1 Tax=Rhizobium sp. LjRoot254 TaxID=3342297 RepID=UPI003ECF36C4